tara:strand:- start:3019 stop:3840 length:822 start_codon:yes stop_codon:yes gene_type:complete
MNTSHYWIYETQKAGSTGVQTIQLQRSLPSWCLPTDFTFDGVFGEKTKIAVTQFQEAMKLNTDGVAGRRSISLLGIWCDLEKGFDASHWQEIDWSVLDRANLGFKFANFKATEGATFQDPKFFENCEYATEIGLEVGAYHFATFDKSPQDEAYNFFRTLNRHVTSVYLDLEKRDPPLKGRELADWVICFMLEMQKHTMFSLSYGIYTSTNYLREKDLQDALAFRQFDLWSANWKEQPLSVPWESWFIWQYTSEGEIEGITGKVDLDWRVVRLM